MRVLSGIMAILLAGVAPALSAEPGEWGTPVDGLRMALALVDAGVGEPQVVEITIENVGRQTPVVQIGWFGDTHTLTLEGGSDAGAVWIDYAREGINSSIPSIPFLVPFLRGSRYQIRRQTVDYVVRKRGVTLGVFLVGPDSHWLRADLRVGVQPDPLFPSLVREQPPPQSYVDADMLWKGSLSSNTLRLPARRQR